jgi:hypothetical protein
MIYNMIAIKKTKYLFYKHLYIKYKNNKLLIIIKLDDNHCRFKLFSNYK